MCLVMYFVQVFYFLLSHARSNFREKENLPPDKKTLSSIMKEQSHSRVDVIKVPNSFQFSCTVFHTSGFIQRLN